MLQQTFGPDALAMAYRSGDAAWGEVLSATRDALLDAELSGVSKANAVTLSTITAQQWKAAATSLGERLALSKDWATQVIAAVGNYAELFDRDAGAKAAVRLDDTNTRVDGAQSH